MRGKLIAPYRKNAGGTGLQYIARQMKWINWSCQ